ncbi:alanine--tRNA ligase [Candidatus Parcubacteria bacterium]|nr:MAG: alanine--tRNA ligase [Candidatus Parcubacteria bacterium]
MNSNVLRQKYLDFFKDRGHAIVPSASLLPENDPSTLFTGYGMQPMVHYLLGEKHPEGVRIADSQKCFRAMDIDDVGDNRHTTFFEMLGNWSLGDYFKAEQVPWMYEFLTSELGLDPKRLYVSVYRGNEKYGIPKDDEAVKLWQEEFKKDGIEAKAVDMAEKKGMQGGRIFYYNEKENWWSRVGVHENMPEGEPGGPDSEMFWDFGEHLQLHENSPWKDEPCHPACDCGRFLEIGNNVFMQFQKTAKGFEELKGKNIDFGGGLERLAVAVADNPDVFLCDVFTELKNKIEEIAGKKYGEKDDETRAFRVIMDHLRASVFLICDGANPSNKDQGYFTRRLIRRAVRFAYVLGVESNFTSEVAKIVIKDYKENYSELVDNQERIIDEMNKEEDKFRKTLVQGEKEFNKWTMSKISANKIIPGEVAFKLFTTYGFPIEMTEEMAQEKNMEIDMKSFEIEMKKHQDLSRTASAGKFKGGLADSSEEVTRLHTTAHLMLEAMRRVLGDHVQQKGSNITAERLRFDFSHGEKITDEQKAEIERIVNEVIEKDMPVTFTEMSVDEAKAQGATGVFESKYGEKVKVYQVGEGDDIFSKEICGGPHVTHTGEIGGKFRIAKEKSSSAGVRRVKAIIE